MNRSTHRLRKQTKMAQSLAVGYQTIFCPAVLVLSTRFTIFRPRGNGVLSSLRLTIRKSFARTSRALMCYRRQFAVYETLTYRGGPAGSRAILIQAGFAVRGSISTRSKGQLMPSWTDVLLFAVDWSKGRGFFYRTSGSNE